MAIKRRCWCGAQVGAKVVLGDRPVRVTLARTWSALSRWNKIRFIWGLLTTGFCVSDDLKAEVEAMKVRTGRCNLLTHAPEIQCACYPIS